MGKKLDLLGKKFNSLLVLKEISKNNDGNYTYLCKCDCGNEKVIEGRSVYRGRTKSCGCLQKEFIKKMASVPKSEEHCQKISLSRIISSGFGKDGIVFRNGWAEYEKRSRKSSRYLKTQRKVFERDNFTCLECGEKEVKKLDMHHIVSWKSDFLLRFELTNLMTLCKKCHWKKIKT